MAIEQTIKQRLIGAIVLVALAVIFLPSILGQKNERKTFSSKVPQIKALPSDQSKNDSSSENLAKPSTSSLQDSTQSSDDVRTRANKASNDVVSDSIKSESNSDTGVRQVADKKKTGTESSSSAQDESAQPATGISANGEKTEQNEEPSLFTRDSWVIQVGSFSSHANAEILSKRLEEQGMKSFVRPVDLKDKQLLYRVFVGPFLDKQQASDSLPKVTDITRLKPIVVKWQPNKH